MNSLNETCPNSVSVGVTQVLFSHLLSTLTNSYCDLSSVAYPDDRSAEIIQSNEEFDFIVVGAGSAGAAVANRLSEISTWKVLLIEAGSDPPVESEIPAMFFTLLGSKYDWKYKTEKSEHSFRSHINNTCLWPRGKVLGGCSSINGNIYVRGNAKDYDNWESLGNPGWNYENVLKYFKKLESVNVVSMEKEAHGYEGYVNVENYQAGDLIGNKFNEELLVNLYQEIGLPFVKDMNAKQKSGFTKVPGTVKNGVRWSTAKAYLASFKDRKNLSIMKETLVTKVLIDGDKKAYGVEVFRNNDHKKIIAKKEVILSAGAVNSPQLLMLSGIGPRDHLKDLNIPLINDLKVGYNLQDHIFPCHLMIKIVSKEFKEVSMSDLLHSYLTKKTELGSLFLLDSMTFVDTLNKTDDYPDIQILHLSHPVKSGGLKTYLTFNFPEELIKKYEKDNEKHHVIQMFPVLLRPKSSGRIMLKSNNPFDPPKIIAGYLSEYEDIKTLIRGVKLIHKLANTTTFKSCCELTEIQPLNDCKNLKQSTDEYYECLIRNFILTVYHPVGSCKMGPKSDKDAVVDARLRVYEVNGSRVADASIMPKIVNGNTNIPAIMIGEKAADLIKEDWLDKSRHTRK